MKVETDEHLLMCYDHCSEWGLNEAIVVTCTWYQMYYLQVMRREIVLFFKGKVVLLRDWHYSQFVQSLVASVCYRIGFHPQRLVMVGSGRIHF